MGRDATVERGGPGTAPGCRGCLRQQQGGGLIEALIALLLLAASTVGTLSAFAGAERGGHAALLRMAAVDLAADAAEELRALPAPMDWNPGPWQQLAAARLPSRAKGGASLAAPVAQAAPEAAGWRLSLRWLDPADGGIQSITRQVDLTVPP
ncbi:MAG: hypothetical protein RLZZ200_798 [Pseudomonadota bacterium]|jgi:hypothetical protein